jgi:hypothetical protein
VLGGRWIRSSWRFPFGERNTNLSGCALIGWVFAVRHRPRELRGVRPGYRNRGCGDDVVSPRAVEPETPKRVRVRVVLPRRFGGQLVHRELAGGFIPRAAQDRTAVGVVRLCLRVLLSRVVSFDPAKKKLSRDIPSASIHELAAPRPLRAVRFVSPGSGELKRAVQRV